MRSTHYRLLALLTAVVAVSPSMAQPATGTYPFGSFAGGPDVINLGNLNVHWDIPIQNKPGRGGPFTYDLTYDSSIWAPVTSGSSKVWQPVGNWGWQGLLPAGQIYASYTMTYTTGNCGQYGSQSYQEWSYNNVTFYDATGVLHRFGAGGTYFNSPGGNYCPPNGAQPSGTIVITDGTGMTLNYSVGAGLMSLSFFTKDGTGISPPIYVNSTPPTTSAMTTTDGNGNQVTMTNGVYTDTLGTTALSIVGTAPSNTDLSFVNQSGSQSTYVVSYYPPQNVKTNFGCLHVTEYAASNIYLVSSIELPDGRAYQFSYESTPGYPSYTTGRLASVTLPTGGQIKYTYIGGSNGIECTDGSAAGLQRSTPDTGSSYWQYARGFISGNEWETTIQAPPYNGATDQTVITFLTDQAGLDFYEIERQIYSGSSTLLETILSCYETNDTMCSSSTGDTGASVATPITRLKRTNQVVSGSSTLSSGYIDTYDSGYGSVLTHEVHDFASGATFGSVLETTTTTYSSTYFPNGGEAPSEIIVKDAQGGKLSDTQFGYSSTTTTTSGTPQHLWLYSSKGNLVSVSRWISGTTFQTASFTYFDTGSVKTATDFNGSSITTYGYLGTGGCGNSFITSTSTPVKSPSGTVTATLTTSGLWNCNGGVPTSTTDVNSNQTTYNYGSDPYWRPVSITDAAGNMTSFSYPSSSSPTMYSSSLTFNSGTSISSVVATGDSLGRAWLQQKRQGPSASNYDSVATSYDSRGRSACRTEVPYSAIEGAYTVPGSTNATCKTYDPLSRPISVIDAGNGSASYAYSVNTSLLTSNLLLTFGPAASGESTKRRLLGYNGAGQLTSACEITSLAGYGSCGAGSGYNGYLTQYTYDGPNLTKTQQNVQGSNVQSRTINAYDGLGRKLSETIPEWSAGNGIAGTTYYTYDTDSTCSSTSAGDLIKTVDNDGNVICNTYDSLHRALNSKVVGGPYLSSTPATNYVYDAATCNSIAMQNAAGNLAEAYTGTSGSKTTDLCFSNAFSTSGATSGGIVSKVWELTPHSGGYFLTTDSYYPNGALGARATSYGSPSLTFGLDGEGRPNTTTDTTYSKNLVTAASYNTASMTTGVTYGNGDSDSFSYDPATNRPTSLVANVVGASPLVTVSLFWNQNWSLQKMQIADTNDPSKNQTCNYTADDLRRLASVNCGTSTWAQNFTYDAFGNINKANAGNATSYNAAYNAITNQVSGGITPLPGYDKNGNQLNSTGLYSISWNAAAVPVSVTPLNGSAITGTFDALNRLVETVSGTTNAQFVYDSSGRKIAVVRGGSLLKGQVPLPGGETAVYTATGLNYIRHTDWLGSSRLATTWGHGIYSKESYAPFGEVYNEAGTAPDRSFTGQDQDTVTGSAATGVYDFMFRKYDPAAGRWLSPDPSGWNAVSLRNPQSLDRYAYALNSPMDIIDPLGLSCIWGTVNGVSVESDDGDGNGCPEAGVAPSSSQDETGTNDGTTSDIVYAGQDAATEELGLLLGQFLTGIGPDTIVYQATDPYTSSFQTSAGMDAINSKIAANCSAMGGKGAVGTLEAFENTVIDGIAGKAGFYTPEAQLGAFNFTYVRDGGTVSVTVTNPVSMNSLLYHVPALVGIQNPQNGPLRTINQVINIQEADPCF